MTTENLNLNGYCLNKQGQWDKSVKLDTKEQITEFLHANVETQYELRITDSDDYLVFHVIDKCLRFPMPENGNLYNVWDTNLKCFR